MCTCMCVSVLVRAKVATFLRTLPIYIARSGLLSRGGWWWWLVFQSETRRGSIDLSSRRCVSGHGGPAAADYIVIKVLNIFHRARTRALYNSGDARCEFVRADTSSTYIYTLSRHSIHSIFIYYFFFSRFK